MIWRCKRTQQHPSNHPKTALKHNFPPKSTLGTARITATDLTYTKRQSRYVHSIRCSTSYKYNHVISNVVLISLCSSNYTRLWRKAALQRSPDADPVCGAVNVFDAVSWLIINAARKYDGSSCRAPTPSLPKMSKMVPGGGGRCGNGKLFVRELRDFLWHR